MGDRKCHWLFALGDPAAPWASLLPHVYLWPPHLGTLPLVQLPPIFTLSSLGIYTSPPSILFLFLSGPIYTPYISIYELILGPYVFPWGCACGWWWGPFQLFSMVISIPTVSLYGSLEWWTCSSWMLVLLMFLLFSVGRNKSRWADPSQGRFVCVLWNTFYLEFGFVWFCSFLFTIYTILSITFSNVSSALSASFALSNFEL